MKRIFITIAHLLFLSAWLHGQGVETNAPFVIKSNNPPDTRMTIATLADTSTITFKWDGLVTKVLDTGQRREWNGTNWAIYTVSGSSSQTADETRDSLETLSTSSKLAGTAVKEVVPVILMIGESNSGGQSLNSDLSVSELSLHSEVQILSYYTNIFEDLDIGANNQQGHYYASGSDLNFADSLRSATQHGWENVLTDDNDFNSYGLSKIHIVKAGQGGSRIEMWEAGDTASLIAENKIQLATSLLAAAGKEPKWYVWMSFGINDAIAGTNTTNFKDSTVTWIERLRGYMGQTAPVFMTSISDMGSGTYTAYETQINTIASNDDNIWVVPTTGLDKDDSNHWSADGMRTIGERMGVFTRDIVGLPYGKGTSSLVRANTVNTIGYSDGNTLQDSPLKYDATNNLIYQWEQPDDPSSNFLAHFRKPSSDAGMFFAELIGDVGIMGVYNKDDNNEMGLLAGVSANSVIYSGDPYKFIKYNAGSIRDLSFTGETVLAVIDDSGIATNNLRVGSLVPDDTYDLRVEGRGFIGGLSRLRVGSLLGDSSNQHIPLFVGSTPNDGSSIESGLLSLTTNAHGSILLGLNAKLKNYNDNDLENNSTSSSLAGTGILLRGLTSDGDGNTGSIQFYTNASGSVTAGDNITSTPTLSLEETGDVGVGITNPAYKLDVSGDVNFTGDIRKNGNILDAGDISAVDLAGHYTQSSLEGITQEIGNNHLTGSATLDFASTTTGLSADLTITVTGAADGDVVSLGVPNAAVVANSSYTAWVSATDTVTVRFNNYSSGTIDPASATFKVEVSKW